MNDYDTLPGIEPVGAGDWVRMMLHSFPGWGKTSLLGTAAGHGRMLIIRSSMDQMPSRIVKHKNIDQFVADTHEKMIEIEDFCRMSNHGYVWVAWDCISTAQDMLLDDIWEGTIAEKPQRHWVLDENGRRLKPNVTPTSGLDRGEYGRNMERMQRWVRHMVGCKRFHFIVTAHSAEMDNKVTDTGGVFLQPWIQGKEMIPKICGYMNMVAFLELKERKGDDNWRRLHTRESVRWYAKDLYDSSEEGYTDNPTIPQLVQAIEKARGRPLGDGVPTRRASSGRGQAARSTTAPRRGRKGAQVG
jgi:hypothetical protein